MPARQLPTPPPQSASVLHGKPHEHRQVRVPMNWGLARKSGTALAGWAAGQVSPCVVVARLSSRPVPQPGWAGAVTAGAGTAGAAVSAEAGAVLARARSAIATISIPNTLFIPFMVPSPQAQHHDTVCTHAA